MSETVIGRIKHIISDDLDVNITLEEIDEDISLFEDGLGLDSVIIVELISVIEECFGFRFSDEELNIKLFSTIRTMADFISQKLK